MPGEVGSQGTSPDATSSTPIRPEPLLLVNAIMFEATDREVRPRGVGIDNGCNTGAAAALVSRTIRQPAHLPPLTLANNRSPSTVKAGRASATSLSSAPGVLPSKSQTPRDRSAE